MAQKKIQNEKFTHHDGILHIFANVLDFLFLFSACEKWEKFTSAAHDSTAKIKKYFFEFTQIDNYTEN